MEKFYLEPDEDFFSIIDRIKRSRDIRIVLMAPAGLGALRSIINLRILKDESLSLGKEIAVITSDSLINKLAKQINLAVAEKIKEEPKEVEWEEKREKEFERKITSGKKVISDIVAKKQPMRPVQPKKIVKQPEPTEDLYEPLMEEAVEEPEGEEFRDLGDKEQHFDELFVKKRQEESKLKKEQKIEEPQYNYYREEKEAAPRMKFFTFKKAIWMLVALLILGGGAFVYFILPKAAVAINPQKEAVDFEAELLADKNISAANPENSTVPAQVFQVETEDSRTFPTTGEKDVSEKAHGLVTVYNQFSSSDQTLVKTTRFRSEDGKIFRLTDTVVIPGATIEDGKIIASSKQVYVEAEEAGDAYNIGPGKFVIPGFEGTAKFTAFYGVSNNAMAGGAKGKMKVATKDDIDGATQIVQAELKNKAKDEFSKSIPAELKLLEGSENLEITQSSSSLQADQPGESFTISVKAKAWGLAFKESDVMSVINQTISSKIAADKFLIQSSIKLSYTNVKTDTVKGTANFICQVEAQAGYNIDEAKLKSDLAGKNEVEVRQFLGNLAGVDSAKVTFWPFWVKHIPSNQNKITITVEGK